MIWLAALDSEPDDRTDEQPRSAHLSRKELKLLAVVVVALVLVMMPIYAVMRRKSEKHVCLNNVKAIGHAMMLYAAENSGRLPPTHVVAHGPTNAPHVENGKALTWVTLVSEYVGRRNDFRCPSAQADEAVANAGTDPRTQNKTGTVPSTFGMFGAYSSFPIEFIERPQNTVLLAETSNNGARDTYDPMPFLDASGKRVPYDGFVIGWNDSNFEPTADTRALTRLAFPSTADGVFTNEKPARHDEGIHVLFMDMHYDVHRAPIASVAIRNNLPAPPWAIPPTSATQR